MKPSVAGILSTGTEILQGLYADTNAQWLSTRLTSMGLSVIRHVAAPDDADSVAHALRYLLDQCDLVIMTGGSGPTEDDLTRQAVGQIFRAGLVEDEKAWTMILERFALRGAMPHESNRVQCFIPRGARILYNLWGTAPGFVIDRPTRSASAGHVRGPSGPAQGDAAHVRDVSARRHPVQISAVASVSRSRPFTPWEFSESALNGVLLSIFKEVKSDPACDMAFLAGEARVDVRLTARGKTPGEMKRKLRSMESKIERKLPAGSFMAAMMTPSRPWCSASSRTKDSSSQWQNHALEARSPSG